MVKFSKSRIDRIFDDMKGKIIAVVGDVMLDRYYWGKVSRLSPEAPVPIVEIDSVSTRFGGSANVANNILNLGAKPYMFGVIGMDDGAKDLAALLKKESMFTGGLVTDPARHTTTKTRVIGQTQHIVRIDAEEKRDIPHEIADQLLAMLEKNISSIDAIIIEDYNKGVLTPYVINSVITKARKNSKPVMVDPKFNNFFDYRQVTVFKPNRKETEEALGVRIDSDASLEKAGQSLLSRLDAEHVLMTLGEKGMSLFSRGAETKKVSTTARRVADVSGAGDTVIATLTAAAVAGASIEESATIANYAAGIVCGEVGAVPINATTLYRTLIEELHNGLGS